MPLAASKLAPTLVSRWPRQSSSKKNQGIVELGVGSLKKGPGKGLFFWSMGGGGHPRHPSPVVVVSAHSPSPTQTQTALLARWSSHRPTLLALSAHLETQRTVRRQQASCLELMCSSTARHPQTSPIAFPYQEQSAQANGTCTSSWKRSCKHDSLPETDRRPNQHQVGFAEVASAHPIRFKKAAVKAQSNIRMLKAAALRL
jgi:hypothetical protein